MVAVAPKTSDMRTKRARMGRREGRGQRRAANVEGGAGDRGWNWGGGRRGLRRSRRAARGAKTLPKLRPALLPIGHECVHELLEFRPMPPFEQVAQLVDHHVLQALRRVEGQTHVDADATR